MLLRCGARSWSSVALAVFLQMGCGSRTRLSPAEPDATPCEEDSQCDQSNLCTPQRCEEGYCAAADPVVCVSEDPCATSSCVPTTGRCESTPLTLDLDGDGFRAPLVGTTAGEEGSCGNDCDDTNALAFPGGMESCDGADNDCDGVVDNGTNYLGSLDSVPEVLALEPDSDGSGRRGLAYGQGRFVAGYWARNENTTSFLQGIEAGDSTSVWREPVSNVQAPSFGADVAWSGDAFGATWADPRIDDNYEVYFARFSPDGSKLGPDLRISQADDFSIHSRAFFDQGRYLLVWDDRRNEEETGGSSIFAQLVDAAGELSGENRQLTADDESAEYPELATTSTRIGVVYTVLSMGEVGVRFRSFDKNFAQGSAPLTLVAAGGRSPRIVALEDRFVVTWDDYGVGPGPSIIGAVVSDQGELLVPARPVTSGASFARSHDTISLGDRFLLFWSDDFADENYELYAQVLDASLEVVEARVRLTEDPADTLSPDVALGESGRVGVLFDDWRSGTHGAYFTSVGCSAP